MSETDEESLRQWLEKADHDLIAARQILLHPEPPTDAACFHAQQAIEKALKALLISHRIPFPKTHNLLRLMDLVAAHPPDLEPFRQDFTLINSFAVEFRYPADLDEPTRSEAESAVSIAEQVVRIIRQAVPSGPP